MPGKDKTPQEILKDKQKKNDRGELKLDWQIFNFLENLIVFYILSDRRVPQESGVCFSITPKEEDEGICLLFQVDRREDPLIRDESSPRPDYLAFYTNSETCICTIIEMKGKGERDLLHGVEQIKTFKDKLKSEISLHFPKALINKIKFQGILLAPPNSQIPNKSIEREAKQGFVIFPIQYHQKAELFNYIAKEVCLTDRYKNENIRVTPKNSEVKFIEKILNYKSLHQRIDSETHTIEISEDREGANIHYALEQDGDYLILSLDKQKCLVFIKENNEKIKNKITTGLQKLKVLTKDKNRSKITFEKIP
ncbi:MAG: hypothetical protein HY819_03520 [Acidobacteria bacterium]|nr:hypothetical protein [Acidobacteriota bacterium]